MTNPKNNNMAITTYTRPEFPLDFKPGFKDTKIVLKRIKEYSGRWISDDDVFFMKGKPSKSKITDYICKTLSTWSKLIIDAEYVRDRVHKCANYVHELQHALRLCGLNDIADNFKIQ